MFQIKYNRSRFPIQQKREDGTLGCRGCGAAIPKYRRTWCSQKCMDKFHPACVIFAVKQRDKGICQECGQDTKALQTEWQKLKPEYPTVFYNSPEGQVAFAAYYTKQQEWKRNRPAPEYDHIIPFSEGGLTVLENMRTLCSGCHKKRTRAWHSERRNKAV